MNCEDARLRLHAYLDDELDAADSLDALRHLAECPACERRFRAWSELRGHLRASDLYRPAPEALRARMAAKVPGRAVPPRVPRHGWSVALAATAALFVAAAVFAGWQTLRLQRQAGTALVAAAVADHVRSLLPGHLIDVRSTDEHTVKPWFDGRVDFSPQVKDLSAQGFELVGGRLDVLDGRPVAALVYRRRLHVINLFQWPGSAPGGVRERIRDGYHVLEWSDAGIRFVAVSSVAGADLQAFARAFRSAPQKGDAPQKGGRGELNGGN